MIALEPCRFPGMKAAYGMSEPLDLDSFVRDTDGSLFVVFSKAQRGRSWDHVLRPATADEILAHEVMES